MTNFFVNSRASSWQYNPSLLALYCRHQFEPQKLNATVVRTFGLRADNAQERSYRGTFSGSMNMAGNIAGGVAPVAVGYILDYSDRDWPLTFWISAAIYLLGGLCWVWIDPVTPLEQASIAAPDLKSELIAME